MNGRSKHFYELAAEGVLSNELLTRWLLDVEERLRKLESSLSPHVTWEVSKAELAETERKNEE
jgi:hypothetical protein